MKKLLLILLSLVLCFSAVACTAEDDTSSVASTESKAESKDESSEAILDNSAASSTESEVSADISDDSSEDSSADEIVVDMEKVMYYQGKYNFTYDLIITMQGVHEIFSNGSISNGELLHYIDNTETDKDTYFLVGLNLVNATEDSYDFLSDIGFIVDEKNMFIDANNPLDENFDSMSDEEQNEDILRVIKLKLPGVDLSSYNRDDYEQIPSYDTVGYITAEAINTLRANKEFGVEITWFPSPDNSELWLTGIVR